VMNWRRFTSNFSRASAVYPALRVARWDSLHAPQQTTSLTHWGGLLRARRERPGSRRAPEQRYEFAAPDAKCHLIPPAGRATGG
jgi:hypothetical protein